MKAVLTQNGQWLSGSIGNIVGASWKGIPYIRSLPKPRTGPTSRPMLAQQAKFRLAVGFVRAFKGLWQISFESPAGQSAFNAMVSYTVRYGITGAYPDLSLEYEKTLISHGRLPGVDIASAKTVKPGQIEFKWENNAGTGSARDDDQVILAAYEAEMKVSVFSIASATRMQEEAILETTHLAGRKIHCYLGFVSRKRANMANSAYAGAVCVPER